MIKLTARVIMMIMMMMRLVTAFQRFHLECLQIFLFDPGQSLFIIRAAARCVSFPMGFQSGYAGVAFVASVANKRFSAMMYVSVKLHMNPKMTRILVEVLN